MCIRDRFLDSYYKAKIYESDPFARLDQEGVGQLVKMAVEKGRATRPNLKCGICGAVSYTHLGIHSAVAGINNNSWHVRILKKFAPYRVCLFIYCGSCLNLSLIHIYSFP